MVSTRRLAGNLLFGVFNNIFRICVQIVMLPLMARLLGPAELGLYLLAMPLLTFVLQLSEAGLGDSLAREKSEGTLVWSSAFWTLIFLGTVLSGGAYAASFVIGDLAGAPRLPQIMLPLCATLFMVAATVIPHAMMLRSGNMIPGSIGEVCATLIGAVVAVCLAFSGFGVWAMVGQFVTTYFVRMVILNLVNPFVPRFEFSLSALLTHTGVGTAIIGGRLIDIIGRMFENAKVSKALGASELGIFGYANQIGRFFSDAVSNTVWANLYFVALHRSRDEITQHYLGSLRLFSAVMFPGTAMLAVALPILVPQLLGEAWRGGIYPIMIMTLTCPFGAMASYYGAVLLARKQVGITLISTAIMSAARLAVAYMGYPYGVMGITIGLGALNIAYYLCVLFFISPIVGNKRLDMVQASVGPLLASVLAGVVCQFVLAGSETFSWLAISVGAGLLTYVVTLSIIDFRRVKADMAVIIGMLKRKHLIEEVPE